MKSLLVLCSLVGTLFLIEGCNLSSSTPASTQSSNPVVSPTPTPGPCPSSTSYAFDDSCLAPTGLESLVALAPDQKVFNVKTYGAVGDGAHDDTVAIRKALSAAESAGGGIVYLPSGSYAVDRQASDGDTTSTINRPIFTISSSDITFIGDGPTRTHLMGYYQGLLNPATHWSVTGDSYFIISRFNMFSLSGTISNVQFRSLDIDGNAGWTGNYNVGGNATTGDGWDMSHKGIEMAGGANDVLAFNITLQNWRGEEFYCGGDNGAVSIVLSSLYSSDADAISCSADFFASNITIGGTTPGMSVYNGMENRSQYRFHSGNYGAGLEDYLQCGDFESHLRLGRLGHRFYRGRHLSAQGDEHHDNRVQLCILDRDGSERLHPARSNLTGNQGGGIITYGLAASGTVLSNWNIQGNTFSGNGFVNQNYASSNNTSVSTSIVFKGNTMESGSLLSGGFYGTYPGFIIENTTLQNGAKVLGSIQGTPNPTITGTITN